MYYIIDANNLAGEMGIIKQVGFDQVVVDKLCVYHADTGRKVVLVFDGTDNLGDNYMERGVRIIRTPRDSYYTSADDMILEVAERMFAPGNKTHEEVIVVTNDLEIHEKVRQLNLDKRLDIKIMKAKDFWRMINPPNPHSPSSAEASAGKQGGGLEDWRDGEIEDVNDELLKIWSK